MLEGHPLRQLFGELIRKNFYHELHLYDHQVTGYLADLLIDFLRTDQLYKIRNSRGKHLEDVGEMLIESNPALDAPSFEREREVRKHIGDFTLFLTGLFPESLPCRRRSLRLDPLVDYVRTGKESYDIVSKFDQFEYRDVAPLFRKLSENFELCIFGLNRIGDELQAMEAEGCYQQARRALEA